MRRSIIVCFVVVAAAATVAVARTGAGEAGSKATTQEAAIAGWSNFTVAGTPPAPAGTTCPGSPACFNGAAEPAIRSDGAGNFYGASENGLGGGTIAVKSADGGKHYASLVSPNGLSQANDTGFAPGGGDVDVAVAPEKNANGVYNVYVSSLTLANIDVSTSSDRGATWTLNPVTTPETIDDREWIAADGVSKVCISYHNGPQGISVGCSPNAGLTFTQWTSALDAHHVWQAGENSIGNLAIDTASDVIYQSYSAITKPEETACAPQLGVVAGTCNYHGVYVAVSTDGGLTFTDYSVFINPDQTVGYGHQFVNISVDKAGNVYAVYNDDHFVYYSFSKDRGRTWSGPFKISASGTGIFPWSAAGAAGKLDVVYYKTPYYGAEHPDNYPMSAAWTVAFAQNLKATTAGSAWKTQTVSPIIHYGGVCESGVACSGNRDLYDDFGVAASPTTGLASIIYSDDQYRNDANNRPGSYCTPTASNTSSCNHTAVATQLSGSGIK
jgi:hypothetical protein